MDDAIFRHTDRLAQLPIPKALRELSLPLVLSNSLLTSYQLVNTFWLGKVGATAVACVSVTFPVIILLVCLGGGLSLAGSTLVAQYAGARNSELLRHVSAQSLLSVVVVALLFSIIGWMGASPLLRLMGVGQEILEESARYLRASCLSLVFIFALEMCQSLLRGIGVVKIPLYLIICSVVLNLILDPLFIFGWSSIPASGVVGAAYATLLTQGLAAFAALGILLLPNYGMRFRFVDFTPHLSTITRIIRLGAPNAMEQSIDALGLAVMVTIVSNFGTTVLAAYGVAFRLMAIAIIPAFAISAATATLVGHNVGAGDIRRARRSAALSACYSFWLLTLVATPVFAFAEPIVRFFVPRDPAVVQQGAIIVRFMAISLGCLGARLSLSGALRGAGDTLVPMVLTLIAAWVIRIPSAYALAHFTSLGVTGLWYSFPISNVLTVLLAIRQVHIHNWREVI